MKTALKQYIEDLKKGNCKGEEHYIELEQNQIIDARIDGVSKALSKEHALVDRNNSLIYYYYKYGLATDKEIIKK